jgi:DNA-binding phage protein
MFKKRNKKIDEKKQRIRELFANLLAAYAARRRLSDLARRAEQDKVALLRAKAMRTTPSLETFIAVLAVASKDEEYQTLVHQILRSVAND